MLHQQVHQSPGIHAYVPQSGSSWLCHRSHNFWVHSTRAVTAKAAESSRPDSIPLGDGDAIAVPRVRKELGPRYDYTKEQAVDVQLQVHYALQAPLHLGSCTLFRDHFWCSSVPVQSCTSRSCCFDGSKYAASAELCCVGFACQALRTNDKPYFDHGIEVMYRFASFDPFQRCKYFG